MLKKFKKVDKELQLYRSKKLFEINKEIEELELSRKKRLLEVDIMVNQKLQSSWQSVIDAKQDACRKKIEIEKEINYFPVKEGTFNAEIESLKRRLEHRAREVENLTTIIHKLVAKPNASVNMLNPEVVKKDS